MGQYLPRGFGIPTKEHTRFHNSTGVVGFLSVPVTRKVLCYPAANSLHIGYHVLPAENVRGRGTLTSYPGRRGGRRAQKF